MKGRRSPIRQRREMQFLYCPSNLVSTGFDAPQQCFGTRSHMIILRWTHRIHCHPVRLQSDNAMSVTYRNHQENTKSWAALKEASQVLSWAENHILISIFKTGVKNLQVDFLSHQCLDLGEWALHPKIFLILCQKWRTPDVHV